MTTTPENVPDEMLIQAKIVHAQLLIKTNIQDIVHKILHIYMVDWKYKQCRLENLKLLVQLDMEDLFTGKTLATFGHL